MNEALLQYIWKFQLFNHNSLQSTTSEPLEILSAGLLNQHAGPDFFNGQVRIDKVRWAGNIEIHVRSSDWYKHNHSEDLAYDKVILHVVWEDDQPVKRNNGELIPTLVLNGLVKKSVIINYENLQSSSSWIPCANRLAKVESIKVLQTVDAKLTERLKFKTSRIHQLLTLNNNNWEATLISTIGKYLGFKVNAVPFELLISSTSYSVIQKVQYKRSSLEALLFGQAGFLSDGEGDDYKQQLFKEYQFLESKYQLQAIDNNLWKFMRMRPANFPTIRIAQLSEIIFSNQNLIQYLVEENDFKKIKDRFKVIPNSYWENHYHFNKASKSKTTKKLGDASIDVIIINAVVPVLFAYGDFLGNNMIKEKSITMLESIAPEKNSIIRSWAQLGIKAKTAADSQGLLQLKMVDCDHKNCLNCTIGNSILTMKK